MEASKKSASISLKIFFIAASFALPIAVLLYLTVVNINSGITFAQWELKGDAYQRPLEDLLQNLQSNQIALNTGQFAKASEFTKKTDEAFQALGGVNRLFGADLQFTDEGLGKRGREHQRVETVSKEWKELSAILSKQGSRVSAADTNAKFDHLTSDIRTMITHVGDISNLILDPDLDSYYLMDVTLLALPQTQDRLAQLVQYGYQMLKRGEPTPEEKIKLAVYAALLQESDVARIVGDVATVINEDKNFYGTSPTLQHRLSAGVKEYESANTSFLEMTKR